MPAESAAAIVTDPPYSSGGRQQGAARGITSKNKAVDDADWIEGDNMGLDSYVWWMRAIARAALRVVTTGSQAQVFTDWRQYAAVVTAWETAGWTLRSVLVWDKNRGGAPGSYWRSNHEWVGIFTKGPARPLSSQSCFNTWTGSKPQGGVHPNEKPIELMRYLVRSVTPVGGLIVDPFAGSGTTGAAALLEGYPFLGVEKAARFVRHASERLAGVAAQTSLGLQ
jgi:site-specific DNA-methyltransferase (adenine-specific)